MASIATAPAQKIRWIVNGRKVAPYLFISPFFILFIIFWIGPILFSFYLGFTKWEAIGTPIFIGLSNYRQLLFSDPIFLLSVKNTFFFVIVYSIIMMGIAVPLALILNEGAVKFREAFRTAYFIPVTVALAVTALIFSMILSRDFGLLNLVLQALGFNLKPDWLNDSNLAMWSLIGARVWRVTGYYMVFVLAGLQAIDRELYDAAAVDGASTLRRVWHVTLPLLRPMLLFVLVMSSLWSFQIFEEPWILTRGGPANATLTLPIYLYQNAFQFSRFGYASAISYLMTLMMIVIAYLQVKILTR
ncbi:MAG: sugar ABC transporter permease [Chloroflexi bacterium]|nr:sugar ABC transporter permease [Chloroflexota bacterium]